MKPILLTIDGINSFYSRQVVDFRFDGLFCISGITGSGKTTILDSIIIALYGSSKRTSLISDYINLRRDKAEIRLVFEAEHDGSRCEYEVARFLSKTATKARLINLTTGETVAEQTEKVNAAIFEMLGLSRDDFTQVVILEQGKFSKFLSAGKKERNNTVGNLFKLNKYKELGSRTLAFANRTKDKLVVLDKRLSELEGVTAGAVLDRQKCIMGAKKRIEELKTQEDVMTEKIAVLTVNKRIYEECAAAEAQLAGIKAQIEEAGPKLDEATCQAKNCMEQLNKAQAQKNEVMLALARAGELKRLIDEHGKRSEAIDRLRTEWGDASADYKNLGEQLKQIVEKSQKLRVEADNAQEELFSIVDFGEKAEYYDVSDIKSEIRELESLLKTTKNEYTIAEQKVKRWHEKVKTDTDNNSRAMQVVAVATEKRDKIKDEVAVYSARLEEERRLKSARFIREGLKEGDVCPVCGSVVHGKIVKVEESDCEKQLLAAREELSKTESDLLSAQKNAYSLATLLVESTKNLNEAEEVANEWAEKLEKLMSAILKPDKIDNMTSVASTLFDKRTQLNSCENEIKLLAHREEAAKSKLDDILLRGESEKKELIRLKGEIDNSGISEKELAEASKKSEEIDATLENLNTSSVKWENERAELANKLSSLKAAAEILGEKASKKPNFDIGELEVLNKAVIKVRSEKETLIVEATRAETELDVMNKELELKKELVEQKKKLKAAYDVYYDIYKLVSGDKFIEYIAEEYILQFTDSASAVLGEITRGKYTLSYKGGDFYVKDFLSGGMERKAGTLSGGETFLASLALAIAISREIARYKTYEFFFLDEGFGTLDSQSLDTVADALTMLSGDTLVGVVTHRSELTDRIFDKITVVAPDGDSGSTIMRS